MTAKQTPKKTAAAPEVDPQDTAEALGITDVTDENDPSDEVDQDTFDLDAWVDGIEATVRAVPIYQRADLIAEIEDLNHQMQIAQRIPDSERAAGDESAASIQQRLVDLCELFDSTKVIFKIRGRSQEWVEEEKKRHKKRGLDDADTELHMIAECVIHPQGVTPALLRKIHKANEAEYRKIQVAWSMAVYMPADSAQAVGSPLSQKPSGGRNTQGR